MRYFTGSDERLIRLLESVPKESMKLLIERHGESDIRKLVSTIRRDGSNTLATYLLRWGFGISYCEIVQNVANKIKVDYKPEILKSEIELEYLIVWHLIKKYFDSLDDNERADIEKHFSDLGDEYKDFFQQFFTGSVPVVISLINNFGRKLFVDILQKIMASIIAKTSAKIVAQGTSRLIGLSVPFLNIIFISWTIIDIAGPAYRKIVPTVFQIGLLRLEYGDRGK